jgi:predicted AAA+ superfamily ATPase
MSFGELLEAADQLTLEEQADLVEILSRRISERRRDELAEEIREAQQDYAAGKCRPATPAAILKNILS